MDHVHSNGLLLHEATSHYYVHDPHMIPALALTIQIQSHSLDQLQAVVNCSPVHDSHILMVWLIHIEPRIHQFHHSFVDTELCGTHHVILANILFTGHPRIWGTADWVRVIFGWRRLCWITGFSLQFNPHILFTTSSPPVKCTRIWTRSALGC